MPGVSEALGQAWLKSAELGGAGHRGGWDQRRWPDLAREAREALARNALGAREPERQWVWSEALGSETLGATALGFSINANIP